MFHLPIEKISKGNPEYALRQKGKIAELALGYGGNTGALLAMGALNMGLSEKELPDVVQRWRKANKQIVGLWYTLESAMFTLLETGKSQAVNGIVFRREACTSYGLDFMTVELPSKRKLYYVNPGITENRFGSPSISYYGINQTTKKWKKTRNLWGKNSREYNSSYIS